MKQHYIGHWNNESNLYPEYPMPVTREKHDNSEDVKMLEAVIEHCQPMYCKGSSICRVCGKMNGSAEYRYSTKNAQYYIPEGYLHYVKDHYVELDPRIKEIYEIIMRKKK